MARKYSNTAVETTLTNGVGPTDTTVVVGSTSGFPSTFPYTLTLDYETTLAEVVLVSSASSNNLTVQRAYGNTSAQTHAAGAKVVHSLDATHANDMETHVDAASNVHGVGSGSNVVGTATAQTLTNKTISGSNNTIQAVPATALTGDFREVRAVATAAANVPLVAKGTSSQTADLFQVKDSADVVKFKVEPDGDATIAGSATVNGTALVGAVLTSGAVDAGNVKAVTTAAATVPLIAKGASAQTADLFQAQDSTGAVKAAVEPDGDIRVGAVSATGAVSAASLAATGNADIDGSVDIGPGASDGQLTVTSAAAGTRGIVVLGSTGMTVDLQQWLDSLGATLAKVDKDGKLTAAEVTSSGALTVAGTPAFTGATGWTAYTPAVVNGGTVTWTTRAGRWKRIGEKTVAFSVLLEVAVAGSGTGVVGVDLPTNPSRAVRHVFAVSAENAVAQLHGLTFPSGTGATMERIRGGSGSGGNLIGSDLTAGRIFTITGVYEEA